MDFPEIPQQQTQAPPQGGDPASMLSAMGHQPPGIVQQGASPDDAGMQIQSEFVDLATGIDRFMKKITDLAAQFPAFGPNAQNIAQAAMSVKDELNQGMMEAMKQLRQQEPVAPPGY